MSAARMVCHVIDHLRVALGELTVEPTHLEVAIGGRKIPVGRDYHLRQFGV